MTNDDDDDDNDDDEDETEEEEEEGYVLALAPAAGDTSSGPPAQGLTPQGSEAAPQGSASGTPQESMGPTPDPLPASHEQRGSGKRPLSDVPALALSSGAKRTCRPCTVVSATSRDFILPLVPKKALRVSATFAGPTMTPPGASGSVVGEAAVPPVEAASMAATKERVPQSGTDRPRGTRCCPWGSSVQINLDDKAGEEPVGKAPVLGMPVAKAAATAVETAAVVETVAPGPAVATETMAPALAATTEMVAPAPAATTEMVAPAPVATTETAVPAPTAAMETVMSREDPQRPCFMLDDVGERKRWQEVQGGLEDVRATLSSTMGKLDNVVVPAGQERNLEASGKAEAEKMVADLRAKLRDPANAERVEHANLRDAVRIVCEDLSVVQEEGTSTLAARFLRTYRRAREIAREALHVGVRWAFSVFVSHYSNLNSDAMSGGYTSGYSEAELDKIDASVLNPAKALAKLLEDEAILLEDPGTS
uniref:Uncharacterized protein n=1 Tax=Setaria viridis TaxID=4556 RepID=A0A4U6UET8_SETVI|nr:hypothetical protein SEVIR_5G167500v2 [Setaria viridis]